ncbi:hypothetical protein [Lignipirellula cremea]|uniref:Uncharacterized protein n=1 Tax=Lignipirellula cremea TaxID=2528010 RepID=A0A518DKR5_9BACT|nr:hypothetical protein [Lignipirellula cremea]QDU92433.1 hypothetical protein Pla8534_01810 [Lignipirellula cremea]
MCRSASFIAQEFEAAWQAGMRPELPKLLELYPHVDGALLLRELLLVEIEIRPLAGKTPKGENWLLMRLENPETEKTSKARKSCLPDGTRASF